MYKITLPRAKTATTFVVGQSVSSVVHQVLKNNVDTETTIQKVELWVAAQVLGRMAADAAKDYTDKQIDRVVGFCQGVKEKISDQQELES